MAGQIRKRGERVWLVRVYLGRDPATGSRKWLSKTVHGARKDAEALLRRLLREKDLGSLARPSTVSLSEYLDRWLDEIARHRVRHSTLHGYREQLRRWVYPILGGTRLCDLAPVEVQDLYRRLLERGLTPASVRRVHARLKTALKQAVRWGLIPHNPLDRVDPPRAPRREMRALSPDQARRFLEAARQDRFHALWWLLLETGLRPAEALALRWQDLDLERGVVHVVRSLTWAGREWRFEEPKTPKARRAIALSPGLTDALRAQRRAVMEQRLRAGPLWQDLDLVFPSELGTPLNLQNLRNRHFRVVAQRAGLPAGFRMYDLRHTSATLLLLAREHPKVVAERLGHATVHMTLDTYSHVLPTLQLRATEKIARLLSGAGEDLPGWGDGGGHTNDVHID
ncbi:MAG: tyrosine-type recombinase/integrase [Armatimonadota bacterium]|nr:tyrosine-type recombinase/integrase [Armatimonadota bacterium]MDR7604403.1 tyrosine-type recombinase/integrase [Armatimonadota bacterium]